MQPISKNSTPPGIRPEAEILLCVAGAGDEEAKNARLRALVHDGIDWKELKRAAAEGRVTSLLYWHLKAACPSEVPAELMAELQSDFQKRTLRNLHMTRELLEILKAFEAAGISAIPYKGPAVAFTAYKNLALREFWDLDIIVRKRDVLKAKDLLLTRGYKPEKEMTAEQEQRFLETDSEYCLDRASDQLHVEIHWQVLPQSHGVTLDPETLWGELVAIEMAGNAVKTFEPENRILILCIHGGDKHQWSRLKWIADIAHMAKVYGAGMDWVGLQRRAEEIDRTATLDLAFYLAALLFDAPIPKDIVDRVRADPKIAAFGALVRGRMFRADRGLPGFEEWLAYMKAAGHVNGGESPLARANLFSRYLRAVLTPCWDDREAVALPNWLAFLHYVMRPIRLTGIHGTGVFKRIQ